MKDSTKLISVHRVSYGFFKSELVKLQVQATRKMETKERIVLSIYS